MRTKIAPDLCSMVQAMSGRSVALWARERDRHAVIQLRAVLAVARAVRPVARAMNLLVAPSSAALERLRLADERLSRASSPRRARAARKERAR